MDQEGGLAWQPKHRLWGAKVVLTVDVSADKREAGRGMVYSNTMLTTEAMGDAPVALQMMAHSTREQCERLLGQ